MTTIIELKAENFKRLKAITIRPSGPAVVISGRNAQGKTSTLDAIMAALGGGRALPADPIRHGEKKASVRVELDDLIVTRRFTKGGSKLEVTSKDGGSAIKSPQAVLDKLTGSLSFDPLAFTRMSAKEQADTLRKLAGLDLSDIDRQIDDQFGLRKDLNRTAKRMQGAAESAKMHPGVPVEPLVISEMLADLDKRKAHNEARTAVTAKRDSIDARRCEHEERIAEARKALQILEEEHCEMVDEVARLQRRFEMGHWEDVDQLKADIDNAEQTNEKVRDNIAAAEARKAAKEAADEAAQGTEKLEELRAQRAKLIEAATFPVEGLTVGEDGVEFQGVAFDQASGAEKIRVSAAIGLAMNPELRVLLIRDGSLMDGDSMQALKQTAADAGAQIWIERVGDDDSCGVVIEDGEIA